MHDSYKHEVKGIDLSIEKEGYGDIDQNYEMIIGDAGNKQLAALVT